LDPYDDFIKPFFSGNMSLRPNKLERLSPKGNSLTSLTFECETEAVELLKWTFSVTKFIAMMVMT